MNALNKLSFFVGLIITLSLLWPLTTAPYFSHNDDIQTIRLFEMDKCFKDGQIPCRWVPDLGGLYGYPLFNYYAPLPYYVGEVFYLLTSSLLISSKLIFALPFVGSFIFMFLLSRRFWGSLGGGLSGTFYSLAPYHAVVFYVRGAMGEMWSLMFFPAILWALFRLKDKISMGNALLLAGFIAGLVLSHNLSTFIFIPVILAFAGFIFYQVRQVKFLQYTGISLGLALLVSAFYWLPMIAELNLVHVDTTTMGYFSYTEHFKGLRKLFLERSWGWGQSVREIPGGVKDGMSFQIGWVHIVGWLASLGVAKLFWKKNRQISLLVIFSSFVVLASIFMIHPRSQFIWQLIGPLKFLQFPWRFLMIIIFFISFLSGSIFLVLNGKYSKYKGYLFLGLVTAVVAFNFSYFRPEKFYYYSDQQLLSGTNWDKLVKRSIYDFLPIYAQEPPTESAPSPYQVIVGETKIKNYQEGTNWFDFQTDTQTHSIIGISKYYFPEWKVLVDGKPVNVDYKNNHLGLINVIIGPGHHYIEGQLYDTPIRSLSNLFSFLGLSLFLMLGVLQIPKARESLTYYLKGLYR